MFNKGKMAPLLGENPHDSNSSDFLSVKPNSKVRDSTLLSESTSLALMEPFLGPIRKRKHGCRAEAEMAFN